MCTSIHADSGVLAPTDDTIATPCLPIASTVLHVLSNAAFPSRCTIAGAVLYALAVLDVPGMPEGRPALLLGDSGEARMGSKIQPTAKQRGRPGQS